MNVSKRANLACMINAKLKYVAQCLFVLFTVGCSSHGTPELSGLSPKAQATVIKQYGGTYKVGNPYQIMGRWYYPKEDYSYSETGMASWYGEDFHAKRTANGEKYDMNTLTAAHRTLPLPSIVRVTNLQNGRSLVVRVNDRGPYVKDRIIDLSKRAAQLLGYQTQGTTKVKVEIMAEESRALKNAILNQKEPAYQPPIQKLEAVQPQQTSATTKFYVQVASFIQKDSALNLEKHLQSFGQTNIATADINGKTYYRVRLGAFLSEHEATSQLLKVQSEGFPDARLIKE